jgi:hypothetical protein
MDLGAQIKAFNRDMLEKFGFETIVPPRNMDFAELDAQITQQIAINRQILSECTNLGGPTSAFQRWRPRYSDVLMKTPPAERRSPLLALMHQQT